MVNDCNTAMRYLLWRAAGSAVTFSSGAAAGSATLSRWGLTSAGALGCVLSGAGPAMLAAVRPRGAESVAQAMEQALRGAGIAGRALHLSVEASGATWERLPQT